MTSPRLRLAGLLAVPLLLTAASNPRAATDQRFEAMTAQIKAEMLANPNRAIAGAQGALAYGKRAKSPRMEATALWLLGEGYSRIVELDRARPLLAAARTLVETAAPGSQLHADILLSEGGVLNAAGEVGRALADLRQAHDLFVRSRDTRSQAKALIMIALVHANGNDHTGALRYFGEAREAYRVDRGLLVAIYNGRGSALKELGRLREASIELERALAIAREMKSPLLYALILSNLADVRLARHDLVAADRTIAQGLDLTRRPDAAAYRPIFIALAAQAAFERGQIARARDLIEQRFAGTDLAATMLPDRPAHDVAYRIYTRLGLSDRALPHLAALKRLDDQATATVRSTTAAIAGARFDFANQELRISQLKAADLQKSVAFEQARVRTQRLIFLGIAGATALIIALLGFGLFTLRRSRDALAVSNTKLGKALTAKTEFLATTSHEIRTPLNGILGMTQVMLADPKTDSATRDRLSVVHGAGVTMRALVDDILDVAKMETGKMTIEEAPADVRRTIVEAARMWEDQARAKGLSFTLDLSEGPAWVVTDPTRLRQIVFNLLSNAVKFTAAGTINVKGTIDGDRWRLSVADTGIGIAPDKHELIFEAFRQADAGTTRQFGGTGLGLSICRNLSRAMGGDVSVTSREGEGATFVLDLPHQAVVAPNAAPADGAGILVFDRNPITRAMFKALFGPVAGSVTFAGTSEEIDSALGAAVPCIILFDDATLRAVADPTALISALAARYANTRIVLLGPALGAAERATFAAAGIARFITRPIGRNLLVQAVFGDEPSESPLVHEAA
ncbi:hypothetical protein F1C10_01980 [Sphingomonas sp. NBWT7]|uniref:ATP-binding protein n=1 Tax=Sphingomonas sp. NBWT7 TaxID=2596913 RepID=UPI00162796A9|nr:ATP-binding protein [Sphingomonas sp. NBWT7]QNE30857.1 hypothetical protein F1C10_01980 [Sphingomonas sp. NBWT7]